MRRSLFVASSAMLVLVAASAQAGQSPGRITLREAVALAVEHHPLAVTAKSKEASADAAVGVAKSEATPRVSVVGQVNRSTGNVVPGATFGMVGIPGIQGPPGSTRFGSGTWQSVAGVTATWDILEIVRRHVIIAAAAKDVDVAKAQRQAASLSVVADAADTYLIAVEAQALRVAADASAKRTETFREVIATLVGQKLRPEIDLARADVDLAAAHAIVVKTRLGVTIANAKLAEAIGEADATIEVVDAEFAALPTISETAPASHPAVAVYEDAANASAARASVAKLAGWPKIELVGAAWLRGGGYDLGGPNSAYAGGLVPDTANWALGIVGTWTPTDIGPANAKARLQDADAVVAKARAAEVVATLTTELRIARETFAGHVAIARETEGAVTAAKRAVELANARYLTGNGTVIEVVDAERARAGAERDDAVARLEAWRAVVAVYRARGDLRPLVGAIAKAKR